MPPLSPSKLYCASKHVQGGLVQTLLYILVRVPPCCISGSKTGPPMLYQWVANWSPMLYQWVAISRAEVFHVQSWLNGSQTHGFGRMYLVRNSVPWPEIALLLARMGFAVFRVRNSILASLFAISGHGTEFLTQKNVDFPRRRPVS